MVNNFNLPVLEAGHPHLHVLEAGHLYLPVLEAGHLNLTKEAGKITLPVKRGR